MIYNKEIVRFTIPLLLKCNLRCNYCHVPNERNEYLDYKIFKDSLYFFFGTDGKQKDLVLYGGEPLLLGEKKLGMYLQILNEVKKEFLHKNITITLVTNLTILNKALEKLLVNIDSIAVSIDGKEKSHNLNRGLFSNTYKNLKKLQNNNQLKNKLSINKVVNKNNVYDFFEDVKYLIEEFNLEIYYNGALTVSDWDIKSVEELNIQLQKIHNYGKEKKILHKLGNFFKIPLNGCPFGTLSLSLDGKIYNCEFMANDYINKQGYVIDLKNQKLNLDIMNCSYNLTSKRCLDELCMGCGKFCTKFSFQKGIFVNKEEEDLLKKVKNVRFNHLQGYKDDVNLNLNSEINIEFNNIDYIGVYKIYNFLFSLNHMLGIKKFNIYLNTKKKKIIHLLLAKLHNKMKNNYTVTINGKVSDNILNINIGDSYAYNKEGSFLGNINSEIDFFYFKN